MRLYSIVLSALLLIGVSFVSNAKKKNLDVIPTYEITSGGTGVQGTYLVEVTLIGEEKNPTEGQMKRAAVHGVLFRGFQGDRQHQRPLAGSAANEAQHADFYGDFFVNGGMAETYATVVPGSRSVTKSGKEYRVKEKIQVNKDALLKDLQKNGQIRGLNNGF